MKLQLPELLNPQKISSLLTQVNLHLLSKLNEVQQISLPHFETAIPSPLIFLSVIFLSDPQAYDQQKAINAPIS